MIRNFFPKISNQPRMSSPDVIPCKEQKQHLSYKMLRGCISLPIPLLNSRVYIIFFFFFFSLKALARNIARVFLTIAQNKALTTVAILVQVYVCVRIYVQRFIICLLLQRVEFAFVFRLLKNLFFLRDFFVGAYKKKSLSLALSFYSHVNFVHSIVFRLFAVSGSPIYYAVCH